MAQQCTHAPKSRAHNAARCAPPASRHFSRAAGAAPHRSRPTRLRVGADYLVTIAAHGNLKEEVLKSWVPVLVDFWASWCGPCKLVAPSMGWAANVSSRGQAWSSMNHHTSMGWAANAASQSSGFHGSVLHSNPRSGPSAAGPSQATSHDDSPSTSAQPTAPSVTTKTATLTPPNDPREPNGSTDVSPVASPSATNGNSKNESPSSNPLPPIPDPTPETSSSSSPPSSSTSPSSTTPGSAPAPETGLLAGVGVVGGVVLLVTGGVLFKEPIKTFLEFFIHAVDQWGPLGFLAYGLVYTGLEVLALPAIPLTMTAGVIFGPVAGTGIVLVSATTAATIAFLIARYVARERVMKFAESNPKFAAIDKAIGKDSLKVVTLLRLSPLLPFALSNYLYGLTSVDLPSYVLGSFLGMLPGTYAFVSAGHLGKAVLTEGEGMLSVEAWQVAVGIGATVLALSVIGRLAKNALDEAAESEK